MKTYKILKDSTGKVNDTVASVLEGKHLRKNSLQYYVRNVRGDVYFYSHRHQRVSRRISSTKVFGEFRPRRYGLEDTTGIASEIWGG